MSICNKCIYNAGYFCSLGIKERGELKECLFKDERPVKLIEKPYGSRYLFIRKYPKEQIPKGFRDITVHYEVKRTRLKSKWRKVEINWVVNYEDDGKGYFKVLDYLSINYFRYKTRNFKHRWKVEHMNRRKYLEIRFSVEIHKYVPSLPVI
ncbi:hypothetical protein H6G33_09840 [Calothrix sp. FACHB-1219]|uniref:hypothetical protein n=1 Tax=unclassified Calothrix TaxID=2619626 RepID=UPI0016829475|nr:MULTISPECIES: hypothetical protein [unclassified Calothrix]MBD2201647.1 hypothetical protein [Calothrix sp. FACHB-168]MBD2217333.1 hypothetical protein [Calothrix sp. FACHB-1219]